MCQVLDPSPSFGIIRNGYTFRITWALTEAIPSAEARTRLPTVVIAGWSIWNAQNASPNALPASTLPQSLTIDDFMAEHAKRKLVAEPVHGRHRLAACEWDEAERAKEIDTGIQAYQRRASTVLSMNTSRIFTTYSPSSVPRSRPKFWPVTQPNQTDSRTRRYRGGFRDSSENRQPRNRAMASNLSAEVFHIIVSRLPTTFMILLVGCAIRSRKCNPSLFTADRSSKDLISTAITAGRTCGEIRTGLSNL